MPIYEYRCARCGHELEAMQKFSDPLLTQCPKCSTEALVKLVSAAGFQLKGGGWYVTDFRGGGKPAKTDAGKADAGKADAGKADAGKAEGGKGDPGSGGGTSSDGGGDAPKAAAGCGGGCACH